MNCQHSMPITNFWNNNIFEPTMMSRFDDLMNFNIDDHGSLPTRFCNNGNPTNYRYSSYAYHNGVPQIQFPETPNTFDHQPLLDILIKNIRYGDKFFDGYYAMYTYAKSDGKSIYIVLDYFNQIELVRHYVFGDKIGMHCYNGTIYSSQMENKYVAVYKHPESNIHYDFNQCIKSYLTKSTGKNADIYIDLITDNGKLADELIKPLCKFFKKILTDNKILNCRMESSIYPAKNDKIIYFIYLPADLANKK